MQTSWKLKDYWSGFDYIPLHTYGSLYLGAWETDEEEILLVEELKKRDINLIVGLGFKTHPIDRFSYRCQTITVDIEDFPDSDTKMKKFLEYTLEKIHIALISGSNVYVHCHAGISRSSTVVIAYLMKYYDYSYNEALQYVRTHRPQVRPNPGFERLLLSFSHDSN